MAKDNKDDVTIDLFPVDPVISGLGIVKIDLKGGEVSAVLGGATNTNDIAQLDEECWKRAIAEWLVRLHKGDFDQAQKSLNRAYLQYQDIIDNERAQREMLLEKQRRMHA